MEYSADKFRYRAAVFLLFFTGAAILIQLVLANRPFNGFEDDAYWLIPSLAYDMESGNGWQQQLSKDTGERGAISLTTLLRGLYIVFGTNPTSYLITAALLHTACSFMLLMAMRECGTERWTAFMASAAFLFCSMQFHAYFWIIGMQHVLVVTSMLLTFIVVNRLMRACFSRFKQPAVLQCTALVGLLIALSFNRPSILLSLFLIAFLFLYYRLDYARTRDKTPRSLTIVYILAMLAAPAYEFIQMSRNGEGWQIAAFLRVFARSGSESTAAIRFAVLYGTYALLVVASAALIDAIARYSKRHAHWQITGKLYFGSIALVVLAAILYDRNFLVLSALAENLFFVMDDVFNVILRWAIVRPHYFPAGIERLVHGLLYLGWVTIFIYARPRRKQQQVLSAVWFVAIAVGLAYVHFLMSEPMLLAGIPSRYIYYFTPGLFMSVALAARRFFSMYFKSVSQVALIAGYGIFIALNIPAIHVRFINSTTAFMNDGDGQYSLDIAQSIAEWIRRTGHTGDVKLNVTAFRPKRWDDLVDEFIPPASSDLYPLFFNAQAFLSQLLREEKTKIRVVNGPADLFLCGRKVCETPN